MAEFDPAATGYKTAEGVEVDVEGEGGVFARVTVPDIVTSVRGRW